MWWKKSCYISMDWCETGVLWFNDACVNCCGERTLNPTSENPCVFWCGWDSFIRRCFSLSAISGLYVNRPILISITWTFLWPLVIFSILMYPTNTAREPVYTRFFWISTSSAISHVFTRPNKSKSFLINQQHHKSGFIPLINLPMLPRQKIQAMVEEACVLRLQALLYEVISTTHMKRKANCRRHMHACTAGILLLITDNVIVWKRRLFRECPDHYTDTKVQYLLHDEYSGKHFQNDIK